MIPEMISYRPLNVPGLDCVIEMVLKEMPLPVTQKEVAPRSFLGLAKVVQTHANQSVTFIWTKVHFFPKLQDNGRQFLARRRRKIWRMTAREDLKFTRFKFEDHRACQT